MILILLFVAPFFLPVLFFILLDLLVICVPEGRLASFLSVTSADTAETIDNNQRLRCEEEKTPKTRLKKYHRTTDDSLAKDSCHPFIGNYSISDSGGYLQIGPLPYLLLSLAFLLLLWHHLALACGFYVVHLLLLLSIFLPKNE